MYLYSMIGTKQTDGRVWAAGANDETMYANTAQANWRQIGWFHSENKATGDSKWDYSWEYLKNQSVMKLPVLKHSRRYEDLLLTSVTFIPVVIPSHGRYERFVSFWWLAMSSFKSGQKQRLCSSF